MEIRTKVAAKRQLLILAGVFAAAAGALVFIFHAAERRAEGIALPRYCDDPTRHVALVRDILVDPEPAGEDGRRPYVIAAKLIYLVPRRADEPLDSYLMRLDGTIRETCR